MNNAVEKLAEENRNPSAPLTDYESKLEEAKQRNTDLNHKLNESQFKVSEANQKIAKLENEKDYQFNARAYYVNAECSWRKYHRPNR